MEGQAPDSNNDKVKAGWTGNAVKIDENTGLQVEEVKDDQTKRKQWFHFDDDLARLVLKDTEVKIYPLRATSAETGRSCFSYFGIPEMALAKLLPLKAKQLGCDPRKHFTPLKNG